MKNLTLLLVFSFVLLVGVERPAPKESIQGKRMFTYLANHWMPGLYCKQHICYGVCR